MKKKLLYFSLMNLAFFAAVVSIYAIGLEYDRANKLYPETVRASYDFSIGGVYGQRWVRLLWIMTVLGLIADAVIIRLWFIKSKKENYSLTQN